MPETMIYSAIKDAPEGVRWRVGGEDRGPVTRDLVLVDDEIGKSVFLSYPNGHCGPWSDNRARGEAK